MVKLIKTKKENEKSAGWRMWGRSDKGLLRVKGARDLGAYKVRGMGDYKKHADSSHRMSRDSGIADSSASQSHKYPKHRKSLKKLF